MTDTPPPDNGFLYEIKTNVTLPPGAPRFTFEGGRVTASSGKATWTLGKKATTSDPYDNLVRHLAAAEEERWKLHADLDALGVIFGRPLYLAIAEHTDNLSEHIAEAQDEAERLLADREGRLAASRAAYQACEEGRLAAHRTADEWAKKANEAQRELMELRESLVVDCPIVEHGEACEACEEPPVRPGRLSLADSLALLEEVWRRANDADSASSS